VTLRLDLKLVAQVGLIGMPSVGKSTLISRISNAKPKIADYPFTTLQPNLGIVKVDDYKNFVMADIPGLIEGAHLGKGLGLQFLRHIERTRILVFLIDPTEGEPQKTFAILSKELEEYSPKLIHKPIVVVLTKQDIWDQDYQSTAEKYFNFPLFTISAVTGSGINELKWGLWNELEKLKK